jgi:adenylosuccinate synthase
MESRLSVVVGGQYGSEGKGAIAGHLSGPQPRPNVVCVRVGGPNAGHTVLGEGPEGRKHPWRLRTIPVAAVTNPEATLVIAAGSEIDYDVLQLEAELLEDYGHTVWDRLYIDPQATVLEKKYIDAETEADMHNKIGSTGKGIGAARAARIMRTAKIWDDMKPWHRNQPIDTSLYLDAALEEGAHVIIEGTQGYGLGLHAGHYPQCTSNDARAIDFLAMAGISPWSGNVDVFRVYVVARVYPIRVAGNSGPLKDETTWEDLGLEPELTTVTRKVRRVGHWDPDLVADAVIANGGAPYVRICLTMLDHAVPETAFYTGPIELLPQPAQQWIKKVEAETGAPVAMVGTGPATIAGSWS